MAKDNIKTPRSAKKKQHKNKTPKSSQKKHVKISETATEIDGANNQVDKNLFETPKKATRGKVHKDTPMPKTSSTKKIDRKSVTKSFEVPKDKSSKKPVEEPVELPTNNNDTAEKDKSSKKKKKKKKNKKKEEKKVVQPVEEEDEQKMEEEQVETEVKDKKSAKKDKKRKRDKVVEEKTEEKPKKKNKIEEDKGEIHEKQEEEEEETAEPKEEETKKVENKEDTKKEATKKEIKHYVTLINLYKDLPDGTIEKALKKLDIEFKLIERPSSRSAKIIVASDKEVDEFLAIKKIKLLKTVAVFKDPRSYKDEIFVSNLPAEVNKEQLIGYMKEFGEIKNVSIIRSIGRFAQICAIVKFASPLKIPVHEYSGSLMLGQKVEMFLGREDYRNVFVSFLREDVSEKILEEYMAEIGEVNYVYIVRNDTGIATDKAVVNFKNLDALPNALKYNGATVHGAPIALYYLSGEKQGIQDFDSTQSLKKSAYDTNEKKKPVDLKVLQQERKERVNNGELKKKVHIDRTKLVNFEDAAMDFANDSYHEVRSKSVASQIIQSRDAEKKRKQQFKDEKIRLKSGQNATETKSAGKGNYSKRETLLPSNKQRIKARLDEK